MPQRLINLAREPRQTRIEVPVAHPRDSNEECRQEADDLTSTMEAHSVAVGRRARPMDTVSGN